MNTLQFTEKSDAIKEKINALPANLPKRGRKSNVTNNPLGTSGNDSNPLGNNSNASTGTEPTTSPLHNGSANTGSSGGDSGGTDSAGNGKPDSPAGNAANAGGIAVSSTETGINLTGNSDESGNHAITRGNIGIVPITSIVNGGNDSSDGRSESGGDRGGEGGGEEGSIGKDSGNNLLTPPGTPLRTLNFARPTMVSLPDDTELPPTPTTPTKPATRGRKPRATHDDNVALVEGVIETVFGVLTVLRGPHWSISGADLTPVSTPAVRMLNRLTPATREAIQKGTDPLLLIAGLAALATPGITAELELAKHGNSQKRMGQTGTGRNAPIPSEASPNANNNGHPSDIRGGYAIPPGLDGRPQK